MRFVNKPQNSNKGFTESEISILDKSIYIHPENVFLEFLKNAGKKSNVFDTDFKDLKECIDFQNNFYNLIKNDRETFFNSGTFYCFDCEYDIFKNKIFYFIKTDNPGNSKVIYYSNGDIPIGENLRDDRTKKIGLRELNENFTEYLEIKTNKKYGETIGKKIKQYALFILTLPIIIPFLIYLKIKTKLKKTIANNVYN